MPSFAYKTGSTSIIIIILLILAVFFLQSHTSGEEPNTGRLMNDGQYPLDFTQTKAGITGTIDLSSLRASPVHKTVNMNGIQMDMTIERASPPSDVHIYGTIYKNGEALEKHVPMALLSQDNKEIKIEKLVPVSGGTFDSYLSIAEASTEKNMGRLGVQI